MKPFKWIDDQFFVTRFQIYPEKSFTGVTGEALIRPQGAQLF